MKSKNLLIGFLTFIFTVGVIITTSSITFGQALGLNWTSLGPDNYSGRTRALLLSNQDPQHKTLFAGGVSGGLWKSVTNGLTWSQINTDNVILNVSCIAQSPSGEIYVGTGESFSSERFNIFSGFIGQGIYKSSDGNTFTRLSSTDPGTFNNIDAEWAYVNKIAAGNNNVVFAATNKGLKVSTNGGETWAIAKAAGNELTQISNEVKIASDGAVIASVDNKVYISNDGSAEGFTLISGETGENELPHTGLSRINLAFAPSDASTIYAALVADGSNSSYPRGRLVGIYVSKDKGTSWRLIGPGGSNQFDVFGIYGDYASTIAVSESNPDKVFIGGMNVWEGINVQNEGFYQWQSKTPGSIYLIHSLIFVPGDELTAYLSTDMGIYVSNNDFINISGLNRNYRTSMFYTVAFDDKGRVLGGTQGNGVLFLDGKGNTPQAANMLYPAFTGGSVEMSMINPSAIFYSSSGGDLLRSADLGVSIANDFVPEDIANANAGVLLTPFRMWESFNNLNSRDSVSYIANVEHQAGETVVIQSKNNRFPMYYTLETPLAKGDSVRVQDKVSSRFFLGVTNAIYMSKNVLDFSKEPTWWQIAAIDGVPSAMSYSEDGNYLWVGTENGNVFRIANIALANDSLTADIGSSGIIISSSLVQSYPGKKITSVSIDQKNSSRVLVTIGTYGNDDFVFLTTNGLDQTPIFNSIQGSLPKMPVYSSIFEMSTSNVIIGTDFGIYTTTTPGENTVWTAENNGMGALPIMSIRQQTVTRPYIENYTEVTNRGAIYIASLGNGIFENKLYVGLNSPVIGKNHQSGLINVYPNPVSDLLNFNLDLNSAENVLVKVYNLQGNLITSENIGLVQKGSSKVTINVQNFSAGTYLLQVFCGDTVQKAKFVVIK